MKKILLIFILLILFSCAGSKKILSIHEIEIERKEINSLLNQWHQAASDANLEEYFNKMDEKAIYLGTDASERWTKEEFYEFCKPYFDNGKAWTFIPEKRTIYFNNSGNIAWFEENLDTWMGTCRGTGVLQYNKKEWKIIHYNLSVAVPNTIIKDYIKLLIE